MQANEKWKPIVSETTTTGHSSLPVQWSTVGMIYAGSHWLTIPLWSRYTGSRTIEIEGTLIPHCTDYIFIPSSLLWIPKNHDDRVPANKQLRDESVLVHGGLSLLTRFGPHFPHRLHDQIAVAIESLPRLST